MIQEIESSQPAPKPNGPKNGTSTKFTAVIKKESPVKKTAKTTTPTKRKGIEAESSDDEFLDLKPAPQMDKPSRPTPKKAKPMENLPKKESAKTPTKASTKSVAKSTTTKQSQKVMDKEDTEGDAERKAILDSIETVKLPDPAPATDAKFNFRDVAARPGPQALGSKEIPVGAEECLTVSSPHTAISSVRLTRAGPNVRVYGGVRLP